MTLPVRDRGVVLLNVLVVVALTSAAVILMIASQNFAVERSRTLQEAGRALSAARGGELSAIAALRRDAATAPETDHLREHWAAVAETDAPIRGGTFSLSIVDAQARYNVNNASRLGGLAAEGGFRNVLVAAGADPEEANRAIAYVRAVGPLPEVGSLAAAGVRAETLRSLSNLAVALPRPTNVNLNTASAEVIAALVNNPIAGRLLVERRGARGYLTPADIQGVGVVLPPGVGLTSDFFVVQTDVTIGGTRQRLGSLLERRPGAAGGSEVVAIARIRGAAPW